MGRGDMVQGKGAQLPKGVWDEHMGLRGSGFGICPQEKQWLERKRKDSILEASPGLQGAQRVQCPGMAEQMGVCALQGCGLPKRSLHSLMNRWQSLGRAGGRFRAVELFCSVWAH